MYTIEDLNDAEQSGDYSAPGDNLPSLKSAKSNLYGLLPNEKYPNLAQLQIIEAVCLHKQYQPFFLREAARLSGETVLGDAVISYVNSIGLSDFQKRQAFTLISKWMFGFNHLYQEVYRGHCEVPPMFHLEKPLTLQMVGTYFEHLLPAGGYQPGAVITSFSIGTIVLSYALQEQMIEYIDQLFPDEPTLLLKLDAFTKTPNCRIYDLVGFLKKYSLLCRQRFSQDNGSN